MLFSLAAAALLPPSASAQTTTRVSVDSAGLQANNGSYEIALSADGRYSAFYGRATNLVPGDTNGVEDVFVHDRETGQVTRVSVDSNGGQANGMSVGPNISADGRFIAFQSLASNLVSGDTNATWDFFVHDRQTGQTNRVSVNSAGTEGNASSGENSYNVSSLSADGRYAAFFSLATNLVPGDTNGKQDVFVHDRQLGRTSRVSMSSAGTEANGDSTYPDLSATGRYVAFTSMASNLVLGDTNGEGDAFVHDCLTGRTVRISVDSAGLQGDRRSQCPTLSADGRYAVFNSNATNLVPGDTNGTWDIFVHDRITRLTSSVSVDSAGVQGNRTSGTDGFYPFISAMTDNGRYVAFGSTATNLVPGDTNNSWDIFLHDRQTGQTSRVSKTHSGGQANWNCVPPSMSADGRYVAFAAEAWNLVPGDTNGYHDVFVRDRGIVGIGLTVAGNCPGAVRISIENSTPHGWVALIYGNAGSSIKAGPPCQGLTMSVGAATLRRLLRADASGEVDYMTSASSSHCGLTLQVVDVTNCAASNTVVL